MFRAAFERKRHGGVDDQDENPSPNHPGDSEGRRHFTDVSSVGRAGQGCVPAITPAWPNDKRMRSRGGNSLRVVTWKCWRRRRDSNPRDPFESNGFQDRRIHPLCHSSAVILLYLWKPALHILHLFFHFPGTNETNR